MQNSLIAPQVFDLGVGLTPGKHRLAICTDNTRRLNLGPICSIRDEGTQTNWNGLLGKIELRRANTLAIEDVQVYPDVDRKLVKVRVTIANATGKEAAGFLTLCADYGPFPAGASAVAPSKHSPSATGGKTIEVELPLRENIRLWDEFSPALHDLGVVLAADRDLKQRLDARRVTFGMRKLAVRGTQFTMNGRPIFLRGTLDCGIFPLTGYPPTDVPSWRRILPDHEVLRAELHPLPLLVPARGRLRRRRPRGHHDPGRKARMANVDVGGRRRRDAFIEAEFQRMVRHLRQSSLVLPDDAGQRVRRQGQAAFQLGGHADPGDPRHLYSSASCGQTTANRQCDRGQFGRGIRGPGHAGDFARASPARTGRSSATRSASGCSIPNFDEMKKYTGVLAAKNFELIRDDLAEEACSTSRRSSSRPPASRPCCSTRKRSKCCCARRATRAFRSWTCTIIPARARR